MGLADFEDIEWVRSWWRTSNGRAVDGKNTGVVCPPNKQRRLSELTPSLSSRGGWGGRKFNFQTRTKKILADISAP